MMVGLIACGKGDGAQKVDDTVTIDAIHTAVKEAYGDEYMPSVLLSEDEIKMMYGVEPEWCEQVLAEIPMISTHIDTLIAIKAVDGKVENVEAALNDYKAYLEADTFQYPFNIPKIKASTVITRGNYVFFIMLGVLDVSMTDAAEEEQLKAYEEMNQIAIEAIDGLLLK